MKNALGPEIVDDLGLQGFVRDFFSGYDGDPVEVPIELAREVVLGSAGYARSLGFDPHPDFAAAEGHLGPWTGPGAITFGKDGKPLYISGPYDDPRPVIRTLETHRRPRELRVPGGCRITRPALGRDGEPGSRAPGARGAQHPGRS